MLLAEVAEQLGHGEMCASALLNVAIIVVRTSQDYARAKALAKTDPSNSSLLIQATSCRRRWSSHIATRPSADDVKAVATNSLL